ncbi:unnamed protein product [Amoebophrya sp. A120]|nr:unnamed protein product [Amoebophrya sp. A120]|eukprot:GSA120T00005198001.1
MRCFARDCAPAKVLPHRKSDIFFLCASLCAWSFFIFQVQLLTTPVTAAKGTCASVSTLGLLASLNEDTDHTARRTDDEPSFTETLICLLKDRETTTAPSRSARELIGIPEIDLSVCPVQLVVNVNERPPCESTALTVLRNFYELDLERAKAPELLWPLSYKAQMLQWSTSIVRAAVRNFEPGMFDVTHCGNMAKISGAAHWTKISAFLETQGTAGAGLARAVEKREAGRYHEGSNAAILGIVKAFLAADSTHTSTSTAKDPHQFLPPSSTSAAVGGAFAIAYMPCALGSDDGFDGAGMEDGSCDATHIFTIEKTASNQCFLLASDLWSYTMDELVLTGIPPASREEESAELEQFNRMSRQNAAKITWLSEQHQRNKTETDIDFYNSKESSDIKDKLLLPRLPGSRPEPRRKTKVPLSALTVTRSWMRYDDGIDDDASKATEDLLASFDSEGTGDHVPARSCSLADRVRVEVMPARKGRNCNDVAAVLQMYLTGEIPGPYPQVDFLERIRDPEELRGQNPLRAHETDFVAVFDRVLNEVVARELFDPFYRPDQPTSEIEEGGAEKSSDGVPPNREPVKNTYKTERSLRSMLAWTLLSGRFNHSRSPNSFPPRSGETQLLVYSEEEKIPERGLLRPELRPRWSGEPSPS